MVNNRLSKSHYLLSVLSVSYCIALLYKNYLYRTPQMLFPDTSSSGFVFMITAYLVPMVILTIQKHRSLISIIWMNAITYGVITVLSHTGWQQKVVLISFIVGALITLVLIGYIFVDTVMGKYRTNVIRKREAFCMYLPFPLIGTAMYCALTVLFADVFMHGGLIVPTVEISELANLDMQLSEEDVVEKFRSNAWDEANAQEKLDALQELAVLECVYLGIQHPITVKAKTMPAQNLGSYNDAEKEISINIDHLLNDSRTEIMDTVCHEIRHAWQHEFVDAYYSLPGEYRSLLGIREGREFQFEMFNYVTGKEQGTLNDYYNQVIEQDARSYASKRTQYYLNILISD